MTPSRSRAHLDAAFVDSSAYLAILDRRDDHHREALLILSDLAAHRVLQVTTTAVVIEAHALILSTLGIAAASRFLRDLHAGNTAIERTTADDEARAMDLIFRYDDKRFSFTDALSFTVMERLGISSAFTFDRNFRQYGFAVLEAPPKR